MIITVIATGETALRDLKLLLFSVEQVYSKEQLPSIYIYTDTASLPIISKFSYGGSIKTRVGLDAYTGLNRQQMERMPPLPSFPGYNQSSESKHVSAKDSELLVLAHTAVPQYGYNSLFKCFTAEKIRALCWASMEGDNVWFLDTDIVLMAPLPTIPEGTDVALSPHMIRPQDEAKYGRYNAGLLWISATRHTTVLNTWEAAIPGSRFFEQGALEELVSPEAGLRSLVLPVQSNFGWWRMWQGVLSPVDIQSKFGFNRNLGVNCSGITYEGLPLQSIHTHFGEKNDIATRQFNAFILDKLTKLGKYKQAADLVRFIKNNFSL